jgi:hypothetical protein
VPRGRPPGCQRALELSVYGEVVTRFGEAAEPALREQVAKALVGKGYRLGVLGQPEAEVAAYDEAVTRFGEAAEPALREQVAMALREARQRKAQDASGRQAVAPVQPPQSPQWDPVVYDDLVRSAFAELVQPGRLLFNPPARMQLGQTERVEVRLARTLELDAELLKHLRGTGEPQLEDIPTAPLMAVTLKGDAFQITAYSDEEQGVTQDGITTWEFDIRALKRGQQHLVMCVSLRIPVPGQPLEHKSIPVREATIYVQVGAPALVGQFVSRNWQWIIGTARPKRPSRRSWRSTAGAASTPTRVSGSSPGST